MGISAFKQYEESFKDKKIVERFRDYVGRDILEQDTKTFAAAPNKDVRISDGRRKILVGHAVNVFTAMYVDDASKEEMTNAIRYLFVCINSRKYGLDPNLAKDELNIKEYEEKYWRKWVKR